MEPMLCFECGMPISDKWDAFLILRNHILAQGTADSSGEQEGDKKLIDPDLNQNLMVVFEALNIEKYCCRQHFTTSKNIHNF